MDLEKGDGIFLVLLGEIRAGVAKRSDGKSREHEELLHIDCLSSVSRWGQCFLREVTMGARRETSVLAGLF